MHNRTLFGLHPQLYRTREIKYLEIIPPSRQPKENLSILYERGLPDKYRSGA